MESIRSGSVTLFYDPAKLARGGKAKLRVHHVNGEATDVDVLAYDLFGAFLKFTADVSGRLDVLQREMERAQA